MIPFPLSEDEINYCFTCGKTVCYGCVLSTGLVHSRNCREFDVKKVVEKIMTCPLCRTNHASYDDKFRLEKEMKRANAGNGESMFRVGEYYFNGERGLQQDKAEGLKWYHRAVEAGSGMAAYCLGNFYEDGEPLEYFQKAAELDFIPAFYTIGNLLIHKGEIEEGMLNLRKAAMCGLSDDSLFDLLRNGFKVGFITKEEYAYTLKENQKACNEMKSESRI